MKNSFDVLHSQTEEKSDDWNHVPIRKIRFEDIKKPTDNLDLSEISDEKIENRNIDTETKHKEKEFSTPKPLLDYLNGLIASNRPLKSLEFDVREAGSLDEVERYLSHSKLTPKETEEALSLIGRTLSKTEMHKSEINTEKKVLEVKKEEKAEEKEESTSVKDLEAQLSESRKEYAEFFVPYTREVKSKRASYAKLMESLGANKAMPLPNEPRELTYAREEYFKIRNKNKEVLGKTDKLDDIKEIEKLRDEIIALLPEYIGKVAEKGLKLWDKISAQDNIVTTALIGDVSLLSYTPLPKFEGTRPEKTDLVKEKIEEGQIKPLETKTPADSTEGFVFPLVFDGKELKVIREDKEDPEIIRVIFDGKEIAKGFMTKKGPLIKVAARYKAGFLLAPTIEQRAFDHAFAIIKTFKL